MSIIFYPDRTFKKVVPAIDRVMAKRSPQIVRGSANVSANALSQVISCNSDWQIDSISFAISNAASKDFGFSTLNGVKVVTDYNDALWFHVLQTLPQRIVLTSGFYTGTQLAAELQSKLNANTAYTDASMTFTVSYSNATGLFVITPSYSTIKYLQLNIACPIGNNMDSIAGHLFGLTVTGGSWTSTVTSNTAVIGLDDEVNIVYNTGSTATNYYSDTSHVFSMDQALRLKSSNGVSAILDWQVVYEELV